MNVRDVTEQDLDAVRRIHAEMAMDYRLPDLESPLFIVKKLVEEDGKVIGACLLRLTAETMLLLSPDLGPVKKMDAMEAMQPEVLHTAWSQGLDDIEARIPDETEAIFEKRLHQLGWTKNRDGWNAWTRVTE